MHMRFKPFAMPELRNCGYFTDRPDLLRGYWQEQFERKAPLYLDLGCGKGVSTARMVHQNPEINYIAIDMSPDILGVARRNIAEAFGSDRVRNLYLVRWNIDYIDQIFLQEDGVNRIYISFCNPWSKKAKQAKRRLTSPQKLMLYRSFLANEGEIYFKTDHDELFEDSLQYLEAFGFEAVYLTRDLHASGFQPNYVSEHEQLYTDRGTPIKFGIFRKKLCEIEQDPKRWLLRYHGSGFQGESTESSEET